MRIIKPYGSTKTGFVKGETVVRKIHTNSFREEGAGIVEFATSHPKLVLAQWISLIDKVITKPTQNGAPSLAQLNMREELGTAVWEIIVQKNLLAVPAKRLKRLEREWWSKIHPYGREAKPAGAMDFCGRWFATFSANRDPSDVNCRILARALYEHLYENEYRIGRQSPIRQTGLIHARADSIAGNVLAEPLAPLVLVPPWTEKDIARFCSEPDLMIAIRRALRKYEGQREARTRQAIGCAMQRHYRQLFEQSDGKGLSVREAKQAHPGLFALHSATNELFKQLLRGRQAYWLKKFPDNTSELIIELEGKWRNRTVNNLVRLGKVIHYEASSNDADSPATVLFNWSPSVSGSYFWSSDGQVKIKQSEAFVRIWRHVLSFAARTITQWGDPSGDLKLDILGANERKVAIENLDIEAFDKTAELLFGCAAPGICGSNLEARQAVLELALTALSRIRNAAFHFSGLSSFLRALEGLGRDADEKALDAARSLFRQDIRSLNNRLLDDLRSVDAEYYLDQPQLDQLLSALSKSNGQYDGLPSFQNVLARGQKAFFFRKVDMRLPPPASHHNTNDLSKQCRHFLLRLLYNRAFPSWLLSLPAEMLREMVDHYVTRCTNEARRISGDDKLIARASGRIKILDTDTIFDVFDMLRKASASEARNYGRKDEAARDLSKYLRDLELDLIAQSFQSFVETHDLDWILALEGQTRSANNKSRLPEIESTNEVEQVEDWHAVLYLLLHLVPVDEINKLAHQVSKTSILSAEHTRAAEPLLTILHLYEGCHDTKFIGHEGSRGGDALHALFENEAVAKSVLYTDRVGTLSAKRSVRQAREMLRFAPPAILIEKFRSIPITQEHVDRFEVLSTKIALAQKMRSELHQKWVNQDKQLSEIDRDFYRESLRVISSYRDVSRHVKLINHLDAYRLLIAALAKLVDYSGIWERDLYFVCLALIYNESAKPNDIFGTKSGRYLLATGQIINALRNGSDTHLLLQLYDHLNALFGVDFRTRRQAKIITRNDLAHFGVLRGGREIILTNLINCTRDLLSYDKKRANAVSKSIIDLFKSYGLFLQWDKQEKELCNARLEIDRISHLRRRDMDEPRVGQEFVELSGCFI